MNRRKGLKRSGLRPKRVKPKTALRMPGDAKVSDPIADAMRREWGHVARKGPCARCGFREGRRDHVTGGIKPGRVQGHHAIPLRVLKREGVPELAWYDQRLMIRLCADEAPNRCHDRLELAVEGYGISRDFVIQHCPLILDYVHEHGLGGVFEGLYPRPA